MAEPSTTAVAATTTLSAALISLIPGVDANAVVGAACGALLFVTSAKDLGLVTRGIYLIISFAIGYLGGPSILGDLIEHSAVTAFIVAAVAVTFGLRAIEGVKTMDLNQWLGGRRK